MHLPRVYTVEEIAEYLSVPKEVIEKDVEIGKLQAMHFGQHRRIGSDDFEQYLQRSKLSNSTSQVRLWRPDAPFDYKWPDENVDYLDTAFSRPMPDQSGKERGLKIGFTNRPAAGRNRRRALVIVNRYPSVEFVASNDFESSGLMASIIKSDGKQLPLGAKLPKGYEALKIVRYRDYVDGPGASSNSAVLAHKDDLETMAQHALLRYTGRL